MKLFMWQSDNLIVSAREEICHFAYLSGLCVFVGLLLLCVFCLSEGLSLSVSIYRE